MAQPTEYNRQYNFSNRQATNPADPLPADQVDSEYNAIKVTLDQIRARLALIQRDDGRLANGSVGADQLAAAFTGLQPPTNWTTATDYLEGTYVLFDGAVYIGEEDHTSGTFSTDLAAGKWTLVYDFGGQAEEIAGYRDEAQAAQAAAETAETNAAASATAAAASETAAATSETNAAASETAAATSETNAAASETAAAASETAAAASEANAATSEANAELAAAMVGVYRNSASLNVPRGLTQASVGTITGGSGGTDGTFALAWSGGNFLYNPTGTFTVSGGAVTAVTITGPGLYIGASPTVPTPSFAASSGLTGASVALTAQFLVTSGNGYWVQSANALTLERYINSGGTASANTSIGPVPLAALTALGIQVPFRPNDYGLSKRMPFVHVSSPSADITLDGEKYTLATTTGRLYYRMTLTSSNAVPGIAVGEPVTFFYEHVSGPAPSTNIVEERNVSNSLITTHTFQKIGNFYVAAISALNASTNNIRIDIRNTDASTATVVRRVRYAFPSSDTSITDKESLAFSMLRARDADGKVNLWDKAGFTVNLTVGTGTPLNDNGTFVVPINTYAQADSGNVFSDGTLLSWLVHADSDKIIDMKAVHQHTGGTEKFNLRDLGDGWFYGTSTVTTGVLGDMLNVRLEVDNRTNSYVTVAERRIDEIYLVEGHVFPNQILEATEDPLVYDSSEIVVTQTSGYISIFVKGGVAESSNYIEYVMKRVENAATDAYCWVWEDCYVATRTGNTTFSRGLRITAGGEQFLAIREVGKDDFMGGDAHGYQTDQNAGGFARFLIDGVEQTMDGSTSYRARRFEYQGRTQLMEALTTAEIAAEAPLNTNARGDCSTRFTIDGALRHARLDQYIEWLEGFSMQAGAVTGFITMLAIKRTGVTHTGARAPFWDEEDMSASGFTQVNTNTNHAKLWGDRVSAEIEIVEGWPDDGEFFFSPSSLYNKMYFSYVPASHTVVPGEIWRVGSIYKIDVND